MVNLDESTQLKLKDFRPVNLLKINQWNMYVSSVLFIVLMVVYLRLESQSKKYKSIFILLVPKTTVLYMMIGDFLMLID